MLRWLQRVEDRLVVVEGWALSACVITMLLLAVYNIGYRNVLVPFQAQFPVPSEFSTVVESTAEPVEQDEAEADTDSEGFGGGFGGGFGEEPEAEDTEAADDFAGGFGGGFGDEPAEQSEPAGEEEGAEGFGGGFGGGFADTVEEEAEATEVEPVAEEVVEPSGFALFLADVVKAMRLEWIDILLRHLVLVCGFLGAMLAAKRRKHITIDALSKVMPAKVLPVTESCTSALAAMICVILAISGWNLVEIGLEFPKELMSWADEWMFQLVFPIGFLMLAFHFGVRAFEGFGEVVLDEEAVQ